MFQWMCCVVSCQEKGKHGEPTRSHACKKLASAWPRFTPTGLSHARQEITWLPGITAAQPGDRSKRNHYQSTLTAFAWWEL